MKFAMLTVLVVFASGVNAAGYPAPENYTTSGDISANSPCRNSVILSPDEVGYSVSARTAEHDASKEKSVSVSRAPACGPSSVGYTVSARRVNAEQELYDQGQLFVNNTALQYNSASPAAYSAHIPVSTARMYSINAPVLAPRTYTRYTPVAIQHRYLSHSQSYASYGQSYSSGAGHSSRTGQGGKGSHRVGGTGSSGKGGHYVGGRGKR